MKIVKPAWLIILTFSALQLQAEEQRVTLSGRVEAQASGALRFAGRGTALATVEHGAQGVDVTARLNVKRYAAPADRSPAFEMILPEPVHAQRVRVVFADSAVHVTELRLFQSEFHEYPPVLSAEETPGLPNWAYQAKVTASSEYKGREPRLAVDGKVDFHSRWYSDARPAGVKEHFIELDLGTEREIGCIQMVTGYEKGGQWTATTCDFKLEYWDGQVWTAIPGTRRSSVPGQAGILLGSDGQIGWALVHRNGLKKNWAFGPVDAQGTFIPQKTFSHSANLREQQCQLLRTVLLGGRLYVWLDHEPVAVLDDVEIGAGRAGFWSAVDGNEIELLDLTVREPAPQALAWLGGVEVAADGQSLEFTFDPLRREQEIQLPSVTTKQVSLQLIPAMVAQKISINGKSGSSVMLPANQWHEVNVDVTSPDGRVTRNYLFRILPVPPGDGMELVFADEFDGDELDLDKWFHRTGVRWNSHCVPEAISVKDGNLRIGLTVEDGKQNVGGAITRQKFGYGYYEMRAKLWKGNGWHSAFWNFDATAPSEKRASPSNNINEIDCFESVGPKGFTTNIHYTDKGKTIGGVSYDADVAERFHTYAWEWTPQKVRFFFDGRLIREESYLPPHGMQNVWLSCVAHPNASTHDLPGEILFDYFRYYRYAYGNETPANAVVLSRAVETGEWDNSTVPVAHDFSRQTRVSSAPGSTAVWQPDLPRSGQYEVFVWNPMVITDGLVDSIHFTVRHKKGVSEVSVNPAHYGQRWMPLGTYSFDAGQSGAVTLQVGEGGFPHRSDAVMFVPISNAWNISQLWRRK